MPTQPEQFLTSEQQETLNRGLRILARMIAQAYLRETTGEPRMAAGGDDDPTRREAEG